MPKKPKIPGVVDELLAELEGDVDELSTAVAPTNNQGRGVYRRQLEQFSTLKDEEKHALLRETWKDVAMGAALRAKALIATCSPKDFSSMYKVVMSGAVAIDKAYPPEAKKQLLTPALVVNMFGSLGQRAARIAMPETPLTVDVTPVAQEVQNDLHQTEPALLARSQVQPDVQNQSFTTEVTPTWPTSATTKTC